MGEEYDFGGDYGWTQAPTSDAGAGSYDGWGPTIPGGYGPSDPASPNYQPAYNPASAIDPRSLPNGGGVYQTGDNPWQEIYAPYNPTNGPGYVNPEAYRPASYGPPANGYSYTDSARAASADSWQVPSYSSGGGGGGGGMPSRQMSSSAGGQTGYQRPNIGAPERTLYDRYKSQLLNPSSMASDPAYKFLYNQGEQALNRSLAAQRLRFSGKALGDTTKMGQGLAYDYMNKMLPQYQQGAETELRRWMGPAGLSLQGTQINNRTQQMEGSEKAAGELLPYYQRMLEQSMSGGGGGGAGPSYGGRSSSYAPTPRLEQAWGGGGGGSTYSPPAQDTFDMNDPNLIWQN